MTPRAPEAALTPRVLILAIVAVALSACGGDPATDLAAAGAAAGTGKADVTVGPIVSIRCQASESFVRRGDFTEIVVDARDAHGAQSRNWELVVTPPQGVRVAQRNKVIFNDDGSFDVACVARDADLQDHAAVQVGRTAPALSVAAPAFSLRDEALLTGVALGRDGEPAQVTVDGVAVTVDAEGRFSSELPTPGGLGRFEVVATDAGGESTVRRVWSLAGPFGDLDRFAGDSLRVGLDGEALGQVAAAVARVAEARLLDPAFQAEILADLVGGDRDGRRWDVTITGYHFARPEVSLTPADDGLAFSLVLPQVRVDGGGAYKLPLFSWVERDMTMTARSVSVRGVVRAEGGSRLVASGVTGAFDDLKVDVEGLPGFIERLLLGWVDDDLREALEDGAARGLDEALDAVAEGFTFTRDVDLPEPLLGPLVVEGALGRVAVGPEGLSVGLQVTVDGETDPLRVDAPGPWQPAGGAPPPLTAGGPYQAALSLDLLNVFAFAAWQTGALDVAGHIEARRLEGDDSSAPMLGELDWFVELRLPPVVSPGAAPGELLVDIGDIRADVIVDSELGPANTSAACGGRVAVRFAVVEGALTLEASVVALDVDMLVAPLGVEPELWRRYIERLLAARVLPDLVGFLAEMPVPERVDLTSLEVAGLEALEVHGLTLHPAGAAGVGVRGDLELR